MVQSPKDAKQENVAQGRMKYKGVFWGWIRFDLKSDEKFAVAMIVKV